MPIKHCKYCGEQFETKKGHPHQEYCCKSCSIRDRYKEDVGLFRDDVPDYIQKYILGLIITDGCITKNGERKYICISLTDFEMIEQIRNLVCPNKKIYKDGSNYQVKWRNDNDVLYLDNLGIRERKTLIVPFPIFEENMWHLIRGIFDGDGCVYYSKQYDRKYGREYVYTFVSVTTASERFARDLNKFLNDNGIESKIYLDSRINERKNITYYISVKKKANVSKLKTLMYKDCNEWALERKLVKFN